MAPIFQGHRPAGGVFRQGSRRPHYGVLRQAQYPVSYYGEGALIDPTTPGRSLPNWPDQQARQVLDFVVDLCKEAGSKSKG
ncbi:hypothetical protein [Accumulibacter sp.]|uniref:hypothetical protein n=1 Tax=Accumulibacter sp. TaxID=2053492 RepID=UPI0025FE44A7|nr:hypothetical protein [Accumulibacter sp.]